MSGELEATESDMTEHEEPQPPPGGVWAVTVGGGGMSRSVANRALPGRTLRLDDEQRSRLTDGLTRAVQAAIDAVGSHAQRRDGFLAARETAALVASVHRLAGLLGVASPTPGWFGYTPMTQHLQTRLGSVPEGTHMPATKPTPNEPLSLSDEQERQLAEAILQAELRVLDAIAREAEKTEFDASRNVTRLTGAACSLGGLLGLRSNSGFATWDDDDDDEDDDF